LKINIVCVGKLKEKYWIEAVAEYAKRLSSYCTLSLEEVKEERLPENASKANEEEVLVEEGKRILKHIKSQSYVIALEIKGEKISSEGLAEKLYDLGLQGKSDVTFIIGGSLGLSREVLEKADFRLSFSKMTFAHQMMRLILLEQLYRSYKIIKNEPYHK
jgi:23S rRNA (pseudouridine1915-N3)-methyltransferase